MEEKNKLADSTLQLKSEIKVLRQKQKSCEETNISNDEILKEIKKIQKRQQNIQNTSKSIHTDYQNTSNNRAEHCNASDSRSCKNRRFVIGRMSLQEIDKPEASLLTLRFKSQHRVSLMKQTRKRTLRIV